VRELLPRRWFADLADAQRFAEAWRSATVGLRVHGTTAQRPVEMFIAEEQLLLPGTAGVV
jgi:hypothetical protein